MYIRCSQQGLLCLQSEPGHENFHCFWAQSQERTVAGHMHICTECIIIIQFIIKHVEVKIVELFSRRIAPSLHEPFWLTGNWQTVDGTGSPASLGCD